MQIGDSFPKLSSSVVTTMINFFLILTILVCTINRVCYACCVCFGCVDWRRQDLTSLKQRATTLRFRRDYRTQDRADRLIEHRLEALLRQC